MHDHDPVCICHYTGTETLKGLETIMCLDKSCQQVRLSRLEHSWKVEMHRLQSQSVLTSHLKYLLPRHTDGSEPSGFFAAIILKSHPGSRFIDVESSSHVQNLTF